MENIFNIRKKPVSFWESWCLPLLALVVIAVFDAYYVRAIVSPVLCQLVLLVMMFRLSSTRLTIWAVIYSVYIYFVFFSPLFNPGGAQDHLTSLIRSFSFTITAAVIVAVGWQSDKSQKTHRQILNLIVHIPVPVILSDSSGSILFVNSHAARILGCDVEILKSSSYFTLFSNPSQQGRFIAEYMEFFDGKSNVAKHVCLHLRSNLLEARESEWTILRFENRTILVTLMATAGVADREGR